MDIFFLRTILIQLVTIIVFSLLSTVLLSQHNNDLTQKNNVLRQWTEQLEKSNCLPSGNSFSLFPLGDPAHDNFYYRYLNENQIFNQYTYDLVSSRVMPGPFPGTVQLSTSNGFNNAYSQLLSSITYRIGPNDSIQLRKQFQELNHLLEEIISNYEAIFGTIDTTKLDSANAAIKPFGIVIHNKTDYLFLYEMGYKWSGQCMINKRPLSFNDLVSITNLKITLPYLPASATPILTLIILYMDLYRNIISMDEMIKYNSEMLSGALQNTLFPNQVNGGQITFNPINGKFSPYRPAYQVGLQTAQISNALNDTNLTITIELDICAGDSASEIQFQMKNRSIINLENANSTSLKVILTYKGFIFVPLSPLSFAPIAASNYTPLSSGKGWYFPDPIAQAVKNQHSEISGYHFLVPPSYNLGNLEEGGNFGMVSGVFIANQPTVTIEFQYTGTDSSFIQVNPGESGRLVIPHVFINGDYLSLNKQENKLTFIPVTTLSSTLQSKKVKEILSIPEAFRVAKILMVAVIFPGEE